MTTKPPYQPPEYFPGRFYALCCWAVAVYQWYWAAWVPGLGWQLRAVSTLISIGAALMGRYAWRLSGRSRR